MRASIARWSRRTNIPNRTLRPHRPYRTSRPNRSDGTKWSPRTGQADGANRSSLTRQACETPYPLTTSQADGTRAPVDPGSTLDAIRAGDTRNTGEACLVPEKAVDPDSELVLRDRFALLALLHLRQSVEQFPVGPNRLLSVRDCGVRSALGPVDLGEVEGPQERTRDVQRQRDSNGNAQKDPPLHTTLPDLICFSATLF